MSAARFIIGDTRDVTASLPDGSVDLVLTSPPFLALRSYLPADHPDKHREIGSEATPGAFLDVLLDLVVEWRRVLAPHGSMCIELGDTYSGSGGAGGDYGHDGLRAGQQAFTGSAKAGRLADFKDQRGNPDGMRDTTFSGGNTRTGGGRGWPMAKSLCGIPHLFHLSLAYGRNLLTGREIEPWRVRNVVAWCRPNPPVGALGDKFRPATSYMTVATVAGDRYFDLDAVRGNPDDVKDQRRRTTNGPKQSADPSEVLTANYSNRVPSHPAGPPPLDHWWLEDVFEQDAWLIPTHGYPGAHYATWPPALCEKPIKAMVPEKVCTTCGAPSRRIVGDVSYIGTDSGAPIEPQTWASDDRAAHAAKNDGRTETATRLAETLGWSDCGHDTWRRGIVLDPFAGSGTTLAVATGHGRDAIGIDIDERNADLARQRVGMLLDVEHFELDQEVPA